MALFGIGGSKSKSKSISEATSQDQSSSISSTGQTIAFSDIFSRLFSGAEGATANVAGNLPEFQAAASSLFTGGTQFLDNLAGPNAGSQYQADRLSGNGVLDEQIGALQDDLGRLFQEELLPGIKSNSVRSGSLGGSRQGVAQGLAAEGIARQFAQGSTALRAEDQAARDAIASDYSSGVREGSALGLGNLTNVLGLAEAGATSDLLPFEALAKILGPTTTLTDSLSVSQSSGSSKATSTSKSKSGSFNFGFG